MEEQLTDSASLQSPHGAAADFIAASEAERLDLHSLLVLHHGTVVAEAYRAPFDADTPHRMYSVTKSFTSSAIGLAIADGLLTVEDRVVDIFPDLAPHPIDPHLAELSVKHLLTMSAEHPALPGPRTSPSVAAFLAEKLVLPPGSRFDYSSPCSYMLAAIVQRLTGEPLDDYLRPRLLRAVGNRSAPLAQERGRRQQWRLGHASDHARAGTFRPALPATRHLAGVPHPARGLGQTKPPADVPSRGAMLAHPTGRPATAISSGRAATAATGPTGCSGSSASCCRGSTP